MRPASLCPKNRSRSAAVVVDTAQTHPRGQSRGNQNIGACRVSTAQTSGSAPGRAARGRNSPSDGSSLKCQSANSPSPRYGGAGSRLSSSPG